MGDAIDIFMDVGVVFSVQLIDEICSGNFFLKMFFDVEGEKLFMFGMVLQEIKVKESRAG